MNDIPVQLAKKLRAIYDNDNFIIEALVYAETDEERQAVIDFIDKNPDITDEDVTIFVMELDKNRNN